MHVRYSLDDWATFHECECAPGARSDAFVFALSVEKHLHFADRDTIPVALALRYEIDGRVLWDNNCGRDYRAEIVRVVAADALAADEEAEAIPVNFRVGGVERLAHYPVVVEDVAVKSGSMRVLEVRVIVSQSATSDSNVTCRYSTDGWMTHRETAAASKTPRFHGRADLHSLYMELPPEPFGTVEFALRVQGDEWHNNRGRNFRVRVQPMQL